MNKGRLHTFRGMTFGDSGDQIIWLWAEIRSSCIKKLPVKSHPPTRNSRSRERLPTSQEGGTRCSFLLSLLMCLPSSAAPPSLPFPPFFLSLRLLSPMMLTQAWALGTEEGLSGFSLLFRGQGSRPQPLGTTAPEEPSVT